MLGGNFEEVDPVCVAEEVGAERLSESETDAERTQIA
jgi:hypothetical protein